MCFPISVTLLAYSLPSLLALSLSSSTSFNNALLLSISAFIASMTFYAFSIASFCTYSFSS
jgi:hypothetical protein